MTRYMCLLLAFCAHLVFANVAPLELVNQTAPIWDWSIDDTSIARRAPPSEKPDVWDAFANEGIKFCREWHNKEIKRPTLFPWRDLADVIDDDITAGLGNRVDPKSTQPMLRAVGISTAEADWINTYTGVIHQDEPTNKGLQVTSASINVEQGVLLITSLSIKKTDSQHSRLLSQSFWYMWMSAGNSLFPEWQETHDFDPSQLNWLWRSQIEDGTATELFEYVLRDIAARGRHTGPMRFWPDKLTNDDGDPRDPNPDNPFYAIIGSPYMAPLTHTVIDRKKELKSKAINSVVLARSLVGGTNVDYRWNAWIELGPAMADMGPLPGAGDPEQGASSQQRRPDRKRPDSDDGSNGDSSGEDGGDPAGGGGPGGNDGPRRTSRKKTPTHKYGFDPPE